MKHWIACPRCDQLFQLPTIQPGQSIYCRHCHALILRYPYRSLDHAIAWFSSALIFYCLANQYPLLSLNLNGIEKQTNLLAASTVFYHNEQILLATLVFFTSTLAPFILIISHLYILISLYLNYRSPGLAYCLRLISFIDHWEMLDVFVLSILVTLVKLMTVAEVLIDIGFYCLSLTLLSLLIASRQIETWLLWQYYAYQTH